MRFAEAGWSEQDHVLAVFDESAGAQRLDLLPVDRRLIPELERLEALDERKARQTGPHRDVLGRLRRDLFCQHLVEEVCIGEFLGARLLEERFEALATLEQPQALEMLLNPLELGGAHCTPPSHTVSYHARSRTSTSTGASGRGGAGVERRDRCVRAIGPAHARGGWPPDTCLAGSHAGPRRRRDGGPRAGHAGAGWRLPARSRRRAPSIDSSRSSPDSRWPRCGAARLQAETAAARWSGLTRGLRSQTVRWGARASCRGRARQPRRGSTRPAARRSRRRRGTSGPVRNSGENT